MALIAHWKLNEDLVDSIGANNGTFRNGVVNYDPGKIEECINFPGGDDYVDVPDFYELGDGGESLSVFVWITTTSDGDIMVSHYDVAGQRSWRIELTTGGALQILLSDNGNWGAGHNKYYISNDEVDYSDNSWHHMGFTWDNGTLKLYADGAEITEVTKAEDDAITTVHNSTALIGIGAYMNAGSGANVWDGLMDDVRIYNHVLTTTEIGQIWNGGSGTEAETFGTNLQLNIGDAWKDVDAMQINIGDVWKDVAGAQINIGDAWKTIF